MLRQTIAHNGEELERIHRAGKIAAVLDIEGSFDLDGDPHVIREFYRLGLRSMQLSAHNWANNYADSCCSPPKWHGINERGREVIAECNRLGMVIKPQGPNEQQCVRSMADISWEVNRPAAHRWLRFSSI